jgi:hypothetical protein
VTVVFKSVPLQFPPQLVKLEPGSAKAVSRTEPLNGALWIRQPAPQLIPTGTEDTVPVPVPLFVTVREAPPPNSAVHLSGVALRIGNVMLLLVAVPTSVHIPLQAVNVDP